MKHDQVLTSVAGYVVCPWDCCSNATETETKPWELNSVMFIVRVQIIWVVFPLKSKTQTSKLN